MLHSHVFFHGQVRLGKERACFSRAEVYLQKFSARQSVSEINSKFCLLNTCRCCLANLFFLTSLPTDIKVNRSGIPRWRAQSGGLSVSHSVISLTGCVPVCRYMSASLCVANEGVCIRAHNRKFCSNFLLNTC